MRRALLAVVDFVVGDDVRIAVGVVVSLALAAAAAHAGLNPWWLLPLAVPAVLGASLRRARG
jgi:hypothetical protein